VEEFTSKVPFFFLRHSIRPRITGWAQVNYKHGVCVEDSIEKLQYDLFYIKNLSITLDFHIFLKTVKAVLFGRGARQNRFKPPFKIVLWYTVFNWFRFCWLFL